jgi:hypothetical protein
VVPALKFIKENKVMRKAEVILEYSPYIEMPVQPRSLFTEACQNDEVTVNAWRKTWESNVRTNHEKYGPFAEKSLGELYGKFHQRPAIVAGAGPSLKNSLEALKSKKDIPLISCLHNFHFLEDNGTPADLYVTLDAGEVTIEEVYEGGTKTPDEYWALSKDRTLLAYIGTSPRLLEKWQGKILFFSAPVPDDDYMNFCDSIEKFNVYVSNGGNVLGACMYISKAFLGASVVAYIGADFSFSYDKKFHSWDSKYDAKMGHCLRVRDIFGLPVYTWKSYHNFKGWFEWVSMTVPGVYFNCSEGGTLGAYEEGNIRSIIQKPLNDFIRQMNMYEEIEEQAKNPKTEIKKLLF